MILKTTIGILVCLLIGILAFSAYMGAFKKLEINISEEGGEHLVFEEIKGDYRQSGVIMDKVYYALLNDHKITTYKGYGIYYDNPKNTDKEELRSEAGCIIETQDIDKLDSPKDLFLIKEFPNKKYITTSFPYKGKMSVLFSIIKVYPALQKYAELNGMKGNSPVMEIYDIPNKQIIYRKFIE